MRVHRSLKFLTMLATFTACSAPAATSDAAPPVAVAVPASAVAPAPVPVVEAPVPIATPPISLNATWDSRPLDLEYRRQRQDMDARFRSEVANPRAGETRNVRDRRHADERRMLEERYSHGRAAHARGLPPQ